MTSFSRWRDAYKAYKANPNGRDSRGTYLAVLERRAARDVIGDMNAYLVSFDHEPDWYIFENRFF